MDKADIPFLTASALSKLIRSKEVSPTEATEAYLDRIQQVNPKLNAYITVCAEQAMEAAKESEAAVTRGATIGSLHGVPVAVKDQFLTRGIRTTNGSNILADWVPDEDATVVAGLKRAGAVLLGKLNMSEFAMGDSFHHPFGNPHNPWDPERSPGTSSSGSGAATAAFLCATSLGEDTGGSIRNPAACCGVVGLRPTYGRVSRHGMLGAVWSMDSAGPISRTVEDCAITLAAIAGHDPSDPYTWSAAVPDYTAELARGAGGVRIGVLQSKLSSRTVDAQVRDSVAGAIGVLEELGAEVTEVSLPLNEHSPVVFAPIFGAECAAAHLTDLRDRPGDVDYNVRIRLLTGAVTPAMVYYKAQKLREMLRREVLEALAKVDVLLLPTLPGPPPPLLTKPGVANLDEARGSLSSSRGFRNFVNLAGVPAISLPCGFTDSQPSLPIGLQLVGRPFEEATLLRVAHAYEQATSWHMRRAPVD